MRVLLLATVTCAVGWAGSLPIRERQTGAVSKKTTSPSSPFDPCIVGTDPPPAIGSVIMLSPNKLQPEECGKGDRKDAGNARHPAVVLYTSGTEKTRMIYVAHLSHANPNSKMMPLSKILGDFKFNPKDTGDDFIFAQDRCYLTMGQPYMSEKGPVKRYKQASPEQVEEIRSAIDPKWNNEIALSSNSASNKIAPPREVSGSLPASLETTTTKKKKNSRSRNKNGKKKPAVPPSSSTPQQD